MVLFSLKLLVNVNITFALVTWQIQSQSFFPFKLFIFGVAEHYFYHTKFPNFLN